MRRRRIRAGARRWSGTGTRRTHGKACDTASSLSNQQLVLVLVEWTRVSKVHCVQRQVGKAGLLNYGELETT